MTQKLLLIIKWAWKCAKLTEVLSIVYFLLWSNDTIVWAFLRLGCKLSYKPIRPYQFSYYFSKNGITLPQYILIVHF